MRRQWSRMSLGMLQSVSKGARRGETGGEAMRTRLGGAGRVAWYVDAILYGHALAEGARTARVGRVRI